MRVLNSNESVYEVSNNIRVRVCQIKGCQEHNVATSKHSFFLILTSVYLLTLGVEGYCCTSSHSDTPLCRTPLDEGSARRRDLCPTTHNTTDRYPCPGGIRTRNPSKRAAADPRLRPRGHWDRHWNMHKHIT